MSAHVGGGETRRLKASSRRNSSVGTGGVGVTDLDWSDWWTDHSGDANYLHVRHLDGDTVHRVHCRFARRPRLALRGGVLYWLVDPNPTYKVAL